MQEVRTLSEKAAREEVLGFAHFNSRSREGYYTKASQLNAGFFPPLLHSRSFKFPPLIQEPPHIDLKHLKITSDE